MKVAAFAFFVSLAPISAWAQKIDVSNHSIVCNTVVGTTSSKPPLVVGGTAPTTMKVKAFVAGCSATGPGSVSIRSGKISGTVTARSNECVTLYQPLTGTLVIKWKPDDATPIVQESSMLEIVDVTFSGYGAPWGVSYGQFSLGVGGVTGAFTGGDNGATSSNVSLTSQDIVEILSQCSSPPGLKTISVGLGTLTLR
jgi:hypothetical protein